MRLFHVSEESEIQVFQPRTPSRLDLDQNQGLVWAINESRIVNFLTPRDCPRVTFYATANSNKDDVEKYIGKSNVQSVIVIEQAWFHRMLSTTLYLYEFDPVNFALQDEIAGYYVSTKVEKPISVIKVNDVFAALFERNVELRLITNLWTVFDDITESSLGYSMCRMSFAHPRK